MTKQPITVEVNLNALLNALRLSLQKVILHVAAGLNTNSDIDPSDLLLPVNVKGSFAKIDLSKEDFREQYTEWVLANGFRDAIESVGVLLESANRVLSVWALIERQKAGEQVTGDMLTSIFQDTGNKFHRLGLPDKIDFIAEKHDLEINADFVGELLTANVARNCLVHRGGIVSDRDLNDENSLKLRWRALKTFIHDEDGEREILPGMKVEKKGFLVVRTVECEKRFLRGERVVFTVEEVSEILWSLFLFGNDLVRAIKTQGIEKGFVREGPNECA